MKAILILIVLAVVGVIALFVMSGHSTVAFAPAPASVGVSTPVSVRVENPHGVRRVQA